MPKLGSLGKSCLLVAIGMGIGYLIFNEPSRKEVKRVEAQAISIRIESQTEDIKRMGDVVTISRPYMKRLLTTDVTKTLQDAKITPVMDNGHLKGHRLTRIKKDSVYEKAGFKEGDVIESINGTSVGDTAKVIKLTQSLGAERVLE